MEMLSESWKVLENDFLQSKKELKYWLDGEFPAVPQNCMTRLLPPFYLYFCVFTFLCQLEAVVVLFSFLSRCNRNDGEADISTCRETHAEELKDGCLEQRVRVGPVQRSSSCTCSSEHTSSWVAIRIQREM